MLPDAAVNAAENAARNIICSGNFPWRQIIPATITETKLIRQFNGLVIFRKAVSLSIKVYKNNFESLTATYKKKEITI